MTQEKDPFDSQAEKKMSCKIENMFSKIIFNENRSSAFH